MRKLRTLGGVSFRRKALVAEAALFLLRARLALATRAFAEVAGTIGRAVPPHEGNAMLAGLTLSPEAARTAREIGWAVRAIAPYVPFRAVCLQQAIAAHAMLARRGIGSVMWFGVRKPDSGKLDAHAWLDAAGVKVTGYPVDPGFTRVACFV